MTSYDTLWITDLCSQEHGVNVLFSQSISSMRTLNYKQEVSQLKANILTRLEKYPHYKQCFFERLSFSIDNFLNHETTNKWKEKLTKESDLRAKSKQARIKLIEDLYNWSVLLQTPTPDKPTEEKTVIIENPFPRIFNNINSFLLFESLESEVRERYKLADYSFIYRRMQKDGYIYKNVVDSEFRDFLQDRPINPIEIDKTKLLDYCKTLAKENSYKAKKNLYQAN